MPVTVNVTLRQPCRASDSSDLSDQLVARARSARRLRYAHLRHVPHVGLHQARQANSGQPARSGFDRHKRRRLKEAPASRKLHDVHQKAPRSGGRTVLIVNLAVDVPLIRARNQRRRFILLAFGPAIEPHRLEGCRSGSRAAISPSISMKFRTNVRTNLGSGSAISGPVRSIINCDSIRRISGVFISPCTTAGQQSLFVLHAQVILHHVEIADQPLALLGHVIAITHRIAVDQQRVAIERLHFEESPDQSGRPAKIPVQRLAPGLRFFIQQ